MNPILYSSSYTFSNTLFRFVILLSMFSANLTALADGTDRDAGYEGPLPYQGHFLSVAVDYGKIGDFRYTSTDADNDNPWGEGNPNQGWGFQIDYIWLPKHSAHRTVKFGAGMMFRFNGTNGKDRIVMQDFLYDSPQALYLNYLAPQAVMKVVPRSDRWSFNLQLGVGVGQSIFKGSLSRIPQYDDKRKFSTIKFGAGFNITLGAEYRLGNRVSLIGNVNTACIYIRKAMYNHLLPTYNTSNDGHVGGSTWNLGIRYHF